MVTEKSKMLFFSIKQFLIGLCTELKIPSYVFYLF